jgi:hypothetical protein
MANVLKDLPRINWSTMTGLQIAEKVKELAALAKLQEKSPEKYAAKVAKVVKQSAPAAKPVVKETPKVEKAVAAKAKKPAAKPAKKAAAKAKPAFGSRALTTEKRIRAMSWIPKNGMLKLDRLDAIRKIMIEFDVPKNYAADWLKKAAV